MKFDSAWLARHEARMAHAEERWTDESIQREVDLHNQIIAECNRRGWLPLHGSTAHRTFRPAGEWDFTIIADRGRVFLIECKTRDGKLTKDQQAFHAWARRLGHTVFVIRNLSEFIELCA